MTDNQPAFCEVDHTSPGAYRLSPRRLTSRSTGKLIATRSRNWIRLARIKASQPPPAQKESRKGETGLRPARDRGIGRAGPARDRGICRRERRTGL